MPKVGSMLFNPETQDIFGKEKNEYVETLEAFSEEFSTALEVKAYEAFQNTIALYGKSLEDPRMLIQTTRAFFRFALAFALVNEYVTLTEKAQSPTGEALPDIDDDNVIAFPQRGDAS